MDIIRGLKNISDMHQSVVTVGTFDGLHVGHTKILDTVIKTADKKNLQSVLLTFEPHPRLVLNNKEYNVKLLTTIDEKIELLQQFNLDKIIVVTFDKAFSQNTYQNFVKNILIGMIKMKHLVIGYDHHFGKDREGNKNSVKKLSEMWQFAVSKVEPFYYKDKVISSSLIRELIYKGELKEASTFLNRYYTLKGVVIKGDGRGKALSFPTANIRLSDPNKIVPLNGVYAVDINLQGNTYKGMMNIGNRPTFNTNTAMEVHIFELKNDIYDEEITIQFKKRLRNEKKFASSDELVEQLKIDKEESLKY